MGECVRTCVGGGGGVGRVGGREIVPIIISLRVNMMSYMNP